VVEGVLGHVGNTQVGVLPHGTLAGFHLACSSVIDVCGIRGNNEDMFLCRWNSTVPVGAINPLPG
jgi:hypothetical protein